jgi:hypothetical protein
LWARSKFDFFNRSDYRGWMQPIQELVAGALADFNIVATLAGARIAIDMEDQGLPPGPLSWFRIGGPLFNIESPLHQRITS